MIGLTKYLLVCDVFSVCGETVVPVDVAFVQLSCHIVS